MTNALRGMAEAGHALALAVLFAALPMGRPVAAGPVDAIGPASRVDAAAFDYRLSARQLASGVYVVEGSNADFSPASNGCNIINTGFITTGAGVVVINTGPSRRYGEQLRALIARTTTEAVVRVVHLNLHPDYFLGNQAFADVPRLATSRTRVGMEQEASSYLTNLYRLCGNWMSGTEALLPDTPIEPGRWRVGERDFELRELRGHTDSDLVLVDTKSGIVFAGGLVFVERVPTTPHARIDDWLRSLNVLAETPSRMLVPSHGPVRIDDDGIEQTRRYLTWLDGAFRTAADRGLDMNEVLRLSVPAEFQGWAAFGTEYTRNVAHLYPRYELNPLHRSTRP